MYVLPEQLEYTKDRILTQFPKGCLVKACGAVYRVCGLRVTTRHKLIVAPNGHPIASDEICDYNIRVVVKDDEGYKRTIDPTWIEGFECEPRGKLSLTQEEIL